jgi:hypothetical protein
LVNQRAPSGPAAMPNGSETPSPLKLVMPSFACAGVAANEVAEEKARSEAPNSEAVMTIATLRQADADKALTSDGDREALGKTCNSLTRTFGWRRWGSNPRTS